MKEKILIIEDDKEMCQELNEILIAMDYQVQSAFDGLKAKTLIENNTFDIIILDLKLPQLSGYEILNLIKKNKINGKIIVITARMKIHVEEIMNQTQEYKEDELLKKADLILIKPFKIIDLINSLTNL